MRKEINITTYKQDKQRNCNLLRCKKNNQYQYRWLFCCNYFPQDKHKSKYLKIGFISAGKKWHKWKKNRKQLISISNPPGKEYPFVDKPFRMVKDVLLCSTVTLKITLTHQTMHHQLYLISTESNNNSLPFVSIAQL